MDNTAAICGPMRKAPAHRYEATVVHFLQGRVEELAPSRRLFIVPTSFLYNSLLHLSFTSRDLPFIIYIHYWSTVIHPVFWDHILPTWQFYALLLCKSQNVASVTSNIGMSPMACPLISNNR